MTSIHTLSSGFMSPTGTLTTPFCPLSPPGTGVLVKRRSDFIFVGALVILPFSTAMTT